MRLSRNINPAGDDSKQNGRECDLILHWVQPTLSAEEIKHKSFMDLTTRGWHNGSFVLSGQLTPMAPFQHERSHYVLSNHSIHDNITSFFKNILYIPTKLIPFFSTSFLSWSKPQLLLKLPYVTHLYLLFFSSPTFPALQVSGVVNNMAKCSKYVAQWFLSSNGTIGQRVSFWSNIIQKVCLHQYLITVTTVVTLCSVYRST